MNIGQGRLTSWIKSKQSGAAAVEMALVLPLLFSVTYATVVYGYVFYVQQSLNRIAEEALRSAVRVDPTTSGYTSALDTAVDASVTFNRARTPIIGSGAIVTTRGISSGSTGAGTPAAGSTSPFYTVKLVLPLSALAASGFATINLPLIGNFPPLPVNLTATASAQVN